MQNNFILVVVSDLADAGVNTLYSAMKICLSKDILSPRLILLGIIRILRADPTKILIGGYEL